jgi:hypothetical protein
MARTIYNVSQHFFYFGDESHFALTSIKLSYGNLRAEFGSFKNQLIARIFTDGY